MILIYRLIIAAKIINHVGTWKMLFKWEETRNIRKYISSVWTLELNQSGNKGDFWAKTPVDWSDPGYTLIFQSSIFFLWIARSILAISLLFQHLYNGWRSRYPVDSTVRPSSNWLQTVKKHIYTQYHWCFEVPPQSANLPELLSSFNSGVQSVNVSLTGKMAKG